jgi:PKHD-type hydroxylase
VLIQIADVLDAATLKQAQDALAGLAWEDGRASAGWSARLVKSNEQAKVGESATDGLRHTITQAILGNALFQLCARPKAITSLLISRYLPGMHYGAHTDDALMRGERTDVSFTLFLSEPSDYAGGALVIHSPAGEEDFKLPAGSLVAYPSGRLHHVAEVTQGVRYAAVGWVRSFIRSAEQRELLFDLDTARHSLFARDGKSSDFDLLSKCSANLLRAWAED